MNKQNFQIGDGYYDPTPPEMPTGYLYEDATKAAEETNDADAGKVEMVDSAYDQFDVMDIILDEVDGIAWNNFPGDTYDEHQQHAHTIMTDMVANALTAVLYRQDAELLDAIIRKATMQAARLWVKDQSSETLDAEFEEFVRRFEAGEFNVPTVETREVQ